MFECADVVGSVARQKVLQHVLEQSGALVQFALLLHHGKELIYNLQVTSAQQGLGSIHPELSSQPSFCRRAMRGRPASAAASLKRRVIESRKQVSICVMEECS